MKNAKEVVLDRAGLIQLAGGTTLLLALCFTAGAVVGFGVRGGGGPSTAPSSVAEVASSVTKASDLEPCVPAEPLPLRIADAGAAASTAPALSATPTAGTPSPRAERYAVQLGVFGVDANADRLAARLRRRGYDPLVAAMRNRSGQWMKRVSLAVYDSEQEAELAASAFQDREGMPAVVVAFREDDR